MPASTRRSTKSSGISTMPSSPRRWSCASNLRLLSELGFGLDLERCAATGGSIDLGYVSPKSGRAVSRTAAEPWADKMLRLPAFLREEQAMPAGHDLADGFALTGYFLTRHALEPRGLALGDERAHFIAALNRALPSVA